jgi:hypothetical protein
MSVALFVSDCVKTACRPMIEFHTGINELIFPMATICLVASLPDPINMLITITIIMTIADMELACLILDDKVEINKIKLISNVVAEIVMKKRCM